MEQSSSSEVEEGESKSLSWVLKNWGNDHPLLIAANASSSVVKLGNSGIAVRYFLGNVEKIRDIGGGKFICQYYSLCVQLLEVSSNCVLNVNAYIPIPELKNRISGDGRINADIFRKGQEILVIDEFMPVNTWYVDNYGVRVRVPFENGSLLYRLWVQRDILMNITTTVYTLRQDNHVNIASTMLYSAPEVPVSQVHMETQTNLH